ncbi:MAG: hypothetical protein JKX67_00550 [Colwellia sp.]|nr:hypothetical protein [Colwellia sp.]
MIDKYYAMHKDFSQPLIDMFPHAAAHGDFHVVGQRPEKFLGETLDLYTVDLDDEFKEIVDTAIAATYTGKLIVMTKAQGKWLEVNYPAFQSSLSEI